MKQLSEEGILGLATIVAMTIIASVFWLKPDLPACETTPTGMTITREAK